jgi:integrase/recombinase XerD
VSLAIAPTTAATAIARQADDDAQLVALWLHGRPAATRRAYARDVDRFRAVVGTPLPAVTLGDLHAYADALADVAPATRARYLSAVKSLLAFGHRIGYLSLDVGALVKLPPVKNTLAERILDEPTTQRILALEPDRRNRAILRLLYAGGLRRSELVGLRWRDLQPRDQSGQVTVFGKGGKTRSVLLPASVWRELLALRGEAGADDPVFRSRKGGPLDPSQVLRIVRAAAARAGLHAKVSPHWLRHGHATHALERGAPVHLVAATLGHASIATTGKYAHARPTDSSARYLAV